MAFVDKRSDGSERVKYDYDGYMAYIRKGLLSNYPNFAADSHWHDDLEFISVLSGSMDYHVNGQLFHLEAGQGIIVNARQLHYGFSSAHRECVFYCVLLHPMLLCASQQIDCGFVAPILSDASLPCIFLDSRIPWQEAILADIETIYLCRERENAPLYIQNAFYHIWILLNENALSARQVIRQDRSLAVLKDMLAFVQSSYTGRVSLEDIARSGNVSKSTCLAIFKKYLQDTPANYLIGYRLKKAMKLLRDTDLSVTEIALEVGFGGASYFSEAFRKRCGCSPSAYRGSQSS